MSVKFIDLFAGMGGIRLGFEQAFNERGFETECVLTSEIKPYAVQALKENFEQDNLVGDICQVDAKDIRQLAEEISTVLASQVSRKEEAF